MNISVGKYFLQCNEFERVSLTFNCFLNIYISHLVVGDGKSALHIPCYWNLIRSKLELLTVWCMDLKSNYD